MQHFVPNNIPQFYFHQPANIHSQPSKANTHYTLQLDSHLLPWLKNKSTCEFCFDVLSFVQFCLSPKTDFQDLWCFSTQQSNFSARPTNYLNRPLNNHTVILYMKSIDTPQIKLSTFSRWL